MIDRSGRKKAFSIELLRHCFNIEERLISKHTPLLLSSPNLLIVTPAEPVASSLIAGRDVRRYCIEVVCSEPRKTVRTATSQQLVTVVCD